MQLPPPKRADEVDRFPGFISGVVRDDLPAEGLCVEDPAFCFCVVEGVDVVLNRVLSVRVVFDGSCAA